MKGKPVVYARENMTIFELEREKQDGEIFEKGIG